MFLVLFYIIVCFVIRIQIIRYDYNNNNLHVKLYHTLNHKLALKLVVVIFVADYHWENAIDQNVICNLIKLEILSFLFVCINMFHNLYINYLTLLYKSSSINNHTYFSQI